MSYLAVINKLITTHTLLTHCYKQNNKITPGNLKWATLRSSFICQLILYFWMFQKIGFDNPRLLWEHWQQNPRTCCQAKLLKVSHSPQCLWDNFCEEKPDFRHFFFLFSRILLLSFFFVTMEGKILQGSCLFFSRSQTSNEALTFSLLNKGFKRQKNECSACIFLQSSPNCSPLKM